MIRINAVRNLSLSLSLAASVFAAPAYAQISVNINIAPPAPQYEVVPTIQPGYVWAPGYWGWNGERYIWIRGRAILQREGYRWDPDRWEQRDRTYYRTGGHWVRDNDFKHVKMRREYEHEGRDNGDRRERGEGNHGHDNGRHGKGGKHGD